ncbi:MAG: helicase [Candidatus Altiarchaeales archaeon A3]|nr:MAG: helicase [Candidatus Altiarchaeales archaeon A3]
MTNVNEIIEEIRGNSIDKDKSFEYAQICSKFLRNPEREYEARKIIINILDNWDKLDKSTYEIWTDLIESAGFYPYLEKDRNKLVFKNTAGEIRKEFHKSDNLENKYFHEEQKILNDILNSKKNLIVSAPTSFGKSLLIEEIVASKKYKNIVVIQPTLALLDETRNKLKKYKSDYKIIVRTSQEPSEEKRNLFLLTAERVMEYSNLPKIDFLVIDEFYKLSAKRDDERFDVLNNALNLLLNKYKSGFYLLGPNIDGISEGFKEKYNAEFYKTDYSLVDNQVIDSYLEHNEKSCGSKKNKEDKENRLFNLLLKLQNEQTIIYCSSPARVRALSKKFQEFLKNKEILPESEELSIIEWIKKNVDERWGIIDCLKYGIGVHDAALQKHMTSSIIKYFNDNELKYLFCTTTIIEGVNTSTKNIIFFDNTKGNRKPIDFFDYCNIKGRSGRFMVHYVGKIFNFNKPPEKENIIVDIPFFEQNPVSDEILIQLEKKDVKNKKSNQYNELMKIPEEERELFKKNGISVKGQKNILEILNKDIREKVKLICWSAYPSYDQLEYVLSLAWDHLLKSGETTLPMTKDKLVQNTFTYGLQDNQNIIFLVNSNFKFYKNEREKEDKKYKKYKNMNDNELFDEAVRDAFQILGHWFQYKIPKWLNVMNELQKYVCEKNKLTPGNYTLYASQIENEFVRKNLSILVEYGIPKSAINKIKNKIPEDLSEDQVLDMIKNKKLMEDPDLIDYEREKIRENL